MCGGCGRVDCHCARWSDGDAGCGGCEGTGKAICMACRGGGGRRVIVERLRVRGAARGLLVELSRYLLVPRIARRASLLTDARCPSRRS